MIRRCVCSSGSKYLGVKRDDFVISAVDSPGFPIFLRDLDFD